MNDRDRPGFLPNRLYACAMLPNMRHVGFGWILFSCVQGVLLVTVSVMSALYIYMSILHLYSSALLAGRYNSLSPYPDPTYTYHNSPVRRFNLLLCHSHFIVSALSTVSLGDLCVDSLAVFLVASDTQNLPKTAPSRTIHLSRVGQPLASILRTLL